MWRKTKGVIELSQYFKKIFAPLSPAITSSGLVKAMVIILDHSGLLAGDSQLLSLLRIFADSPLYFLPVLLAYTSALCFGANVLLSVSIAGILLHPMFIDLLEGGILNILGFGLSGYSYSFSVFPVIMSVYFLSVVENWLENIRNKRAVHFLKPFVSFVLVAVASVAVFGPLGLLVGEGLVRCIQLLDASLPWLSPTLVGALTPIFVLTGTHYFLVPIGINNIVGIGYDSFVGPGILASNMAQTGAVLSLALLTKNERQKYVSSAFTSFFGISEPTVYNIYPRREILPIILFSGGISGLFIGLSGVYRYATAVPGILALPGYISRDDPQNFTNLILAIVIAFFTSFVGTLFISKENEVTYVRFFTKKVNEICVLSPLKGEVISLDKVPDETFATKILGDGVAIIPSVGILYASDDGEVLSVADTKHAVAVRYTNGVEILVHIGIDTVELGGEGYDALVQADDKIKKGDVLIKFDIDIIKKKGYSVITPVIITNSDEFAVVSCHEGNIDTFETLLKLKK